MAKYSEKYKLMLVKEYQEGKLGYMLLAEKHGMKDSTPIKRWVKVTPLEEALGIVKDSKYRTTIHSDQGWHYQHSKWGTTLKEHKVFQSMSRKGNCLDNSPLENFFGLMKQEMYYGEALCSFEELKKRIVEYINYYNNKHIKQKLAGMGPVQFRIHTSQLAA